MPLKFSQISQVCTRVQRWHTHLLRETHEHHHHVAEVLERLQEHQLFLKAEKCSFQETSIKFLGYKISQEGIAMDKEKVAAVRTLKSYNVFSDSATLLQIFKGLQRHSYPLTNLLKG